MAADIATTGVAATIKYMAAAATVTASVALANPAEPLVPILGISQSVLLVAIVGALIAVLILPTTDESRAVNDPDLMGWRRLLMLLARAGALGAVVLCYAIAAAWLVSLAGHWFPQLDGSPQLPLAGVSGLLIRRLLPRYIAVVERVTEWVGGKRA